MNLLPEARTNYDRDYHQPVLDPPLQNAGDLLIEDELGGEGVGGDEEGCHPGLIQSLSDLIEPLPARADPLVVPCLEQALRFEDPQVGGQAVLPDLVLVAVAEEDLGRRHFRGL